MSTVKNNSFEPPIIFDFHAHLHVPGTEKWAKINHIDRTVLLAGSSNNDKILDFWPLSGKLFLI